MQDRKLPFTQYGPPKISPQGGGGAAYGSRGSGVSTEVYTDDGTVGGGGGSYMDTFEKNKSRDFFILKYFYDIM